MTKAEKMAKVMKGNRNSNKRYMEGKYSIDPNLDPYENLAAAIVYQAIWDVQYTKRHPKQKTLNGVLCNKYELLNFFRSKWCALLLQTSDTEELIEKIKLMEVFK